MDTLKEQVALILGFNQYFDEQERIGGVLRKCSLTSLKTRKDGNAMYASKGHDKNIHRQILSLYSESIAFAPKDSEELAAAYSNRSALLLHLHKYDECLIDVERAFQITKSEELKIKLLARKTKCLMLTQGAKSLKNQSQSQKLPEMVLSKKIPCAEDCFSIKYNEQIGRHLVATRDIKPGKVIIVEEGYAAFPKRAHVYLTCSRCLCFAWTGIPCDSCALVIYCSQECKDKAWQEYHGIECCILPFLLCMKNQNRAMFVITTVVMTARLFIKAVKKEGLTNVIRDAKALDNGKGLSLIIKFMILFSFIIHKDPWTFQSIFFPDMHVKGFFDNGVFSSDRFRACYNLLDHAKKKEKDDNFESMIVNLLFRHSDIFDAESDDSEMIDGSTLVFLKSILVKIRNILEVNCYSVQYYYNYMLFFFF